MTTSKVWCGRAEHVGVLFYLCPSLGCLDLPPAAGEIEVPRGTPEWCPVANDGQHERTAEPADGCVLCGWDFDEPPFSVECAHCGHDAEAHRNGFGRLADCGVDKEAGFCGCTQYEEPQK